MQKCDHCKKFAGGCSWTDTDLETGHTKFQPVEGWTAERSEVGYHIIDCPEFESDGTENRSNILPVGLKWDAETFLDYVLAGMTNAEIKRRMGMPINTILAYKTMLRKVGRLS